MSTQISIIENNKQLIELVEQSTHSFDEKQLMIRTISTRFCDLKVDISQNVNEKTFFISEEFEKALLRNGSQKLDPMEKGFIVSEIVEYLEGFKQLTVKEISFIFQQGSLGLLGKNFGINVKSVVSWITAYLDDEVRKMALKKLNVLKIQKAKVDELTYDQRQEIIKKSIIEIYKERIENQFENTEMLSYPIYDYLKVNGFINLNAVQKEYLIEEAQEIQKANLIAGRSIREQETIIKQIDTGEISVEQTAKVLAVRDFMNHLAMMGKELPF